MTDTLASASFAGFDAYLRQARRLQGQGAEKLAHDHIMAALGAAMMAARQAAEATIRDGANIADALETAAAKLQELRASLVSDSRI